MNHARGTSALLISLLIGSGVIVGRLVPPIVVRLGGTVPRVGWAAALTLLFAAIVVAVFAWNTWQSLHKKHQRMTSDHGLQMLALAKSGVAVGASVAGIYAGFALAFIDATGSPLGKERVVHAGAAAIASLLLMIAALLLEHSCRLPGDDEEGKGGKATPDATPA